MSIADSRSTPAADDPPHAQGKSSASVYRHSAWTRVTHWVWAVCLFFLLLTGLQIFNAHPALYIGDQSGFAFDNSVLRIGAERTADGATGYTEILGMKFDTTGVLGLSGSSSLTQSARAFPAWATIPSAQDLATGRVVHFFFAWVLFATLIVWLVASLINGHARRDLLPGARDIKGIPSDIANHARLRFRHMRDYGPLQKLSYAAVLFVMLPLMFLTGLAMSPGANAALPFLPEILGGRQTARTIHFVVMALLVAFFVIHILMVVLAGPINEMRSMITGWYRTDKREGE
jgi:thiosulfate reductase cytochrome b subunit